MSQLYVDQIYGPSISETPSFPNGLVSNSFNGSQIAGFRNVILNGKMDIGQQGVSFTNPTTGTYLLDQWQFAKSTTSTINSSRSAVTPSKEFGFSLRLEITTADTSFTESEFLLVQQPVEGFSARSLLEKTCTLSFWVKSSKIGIHCIAIRNGGYDRSYVAEYSVNASNTWEKKSITIENGLIDSGTWNWSTGLGLTLCFTLGAGPTRQAPSVGWNTGDFLATANQVNCADTVGNVFEIVGVQLEAGPVATEFEHRSIAQELILNKRYFEMINSWFLGYSGGVNSLAGTNISYIQKRSTPTVVESNVMENVNLSSVVFGPVGLESLRMYGIAAAGGNMIRTSVISLNSRLT